MAKIKITLNGKESEFEENASIEFILNELGVAPQNVIAELDGEVVTHENFSSRFIKPNSKLELIKFVGGG